MRAACQSSADRALAHPQVPRTQQRDLPEGDPAVTDVAMAACVLSGLAENAVQVGAADGADALGHASALVVDSHFTFGLPLCLALHAVELTAPGLRHDGLLAYRSCWSSRRGSRNPPGPPLMAAVLHTTAAALPNHATGGRKLAIPRSDQQLSVRLTPFRAFVVLSVRLISQSAHPRSGNR